MLSYMSFGQNPTCDGTRYLNPVYTPTSTTGILFGNNTTIGGSNQDLYLDFFEPSGDLAAERPLIILAFGGSFIGGQRSDMHPFCEYYAAMGYTCAAIDYRLYDGPLFPLPDSVTMTDEVLKAVSDMKAAIRFFREDAANSNTYKVDTNLIFVGGISAGGIVAGHAGNLDPTDPIESYIDPLITANGGFTGNSSTNIQYGDGVSGILNFSGALRDAAYIDANDPPLFSVHDDGDDVVPYAAGYASIATFPIIALEGSFLMDQQAQSVGVTSELITIPNSANHVGYFNNATSTDTILGHSLDFLYPIVCAGSIGIQELTASDVHIYPNPSNTQVSISINEETSLEIKLFDLSGRFISQTESLGGKATFDVSELQGGTYLIEVQSRNGLVRKQLIVE